MDHSEALDTSSYGDVEDAHPVRARSVRYSFSSAYRSSEGSVKGLKDIEKEKMDRYNLSSLANTRPSGDFLSYLSAKRLQRKPDLWLMGARKSTAEVESSSDSSMSLPDWFKDESLEVFLQIHGVGQYKAWLKLAQAPPWTETGSATSYGLLDKRVKATKVKHQQPLRRGEIVYWSGSSYDGEWCVNYMHGTGTFTLPHGSCYVGGMGDGMFFGQGDLYFPNGSHVKGQWVRGKLIGGHYVFGDGLAIRNKNWRYCMGSNRRYQEELVHGLRPAGRSLITNKAPPRKIPPGCYDTGDGFYVRSKGIVVSATTGEFIRVPSAEEQTWIVKNCRKSWDEYLKHRALYGKKLY